MDGIAELRTLISGNDGKFAVKDKAGKETNLNGLNLRDMIEFERAMGKSALDMFDTVKLEEIAYLMYLSVRKEGLSLAEIREKKFKITLDDVYENFDLGMFPEVVLIYTKILELSGLKPRKEKEGADPNPPAKGEDAK